MVDFSQFDRENHRSCCLGIGLGGGLVLCALLVVVAVWARRGRLPDVDLAIHTEEFSAWRVVAPQSYDIETEVSGRQPAIYRVRVRGGDVVSATRNGVDLRQRRTMGTWSVPGMFDTMESDLVNEADDQNDRLMHNSPRVTVRARFHPKWHYPESYQRIEWGSHYEVDWQVTKFVVVDDRSPPLDPTVPNSVMPAPSATDATNIEIIGDGRGSRLEQEIVTPTSSPFDGGSAKGTATE